MNNEPRPGINLGGVACTLAAASLLAACVVEPLPPPHYYAPPQRPIAVYEPAAPEPVVSVYIDPPLYQPAPIAVSWAPPPMLVEVPPPQPDGEAVWTGGYWAWQGRWVWSAGRWSAPPQPRYLWVQPYYEHRADAVIFVPGFWSPPEVRFVPPPIGLSIALAVVVGAAFVGHPPMGPQGVFIPPPPGSRPGIIVPAPIGTPPAVVVSAPPVVNVGMRVRGNVENDSHNTTINENRVTNNVTNVTNVTIVAPAGATANGQAFQSSVPARAHLAAALPPVVRATAPVPSSGNAIPSYVAGHAPPALPPPQRVRGEPNGAGNPRPEFSPPPRQPAPVQPPMQSPQQQARQQPQQHLQPQPQPQPQPQLQLQPQLQPQLQAQTPPQSASPQPDPRAHDPSMRGNDAVRRARPQGDPDARGDASQAGTPNARQPHEGKPKVEHDKKKDKDKAEDKKEHDGERRE